MPEYLSPGVYIEEIPAGIQAIEGVSTSTAGFVGRAQRGTVPGFQWSPATKELPFIPDKGFVLAPDPAPVLVTSFAEFQREFGPPLPVPNPGDPNDYGYLGWAVRAFFDNGGKRVYVARIVDPGDKPSLIRVAQGVAYRLLRSAPKNQPTVFLTSTRGLNIGDKITFTRHSDGSVVLTSAAITSWDSHANSVTFSGNLSAALDPGDVYGVVAGSPLEPGVNRGPQFFARSPGAWSAGLQVLIANSDRSAVPILGAGIIAAGALKLQVQNLASLYVGAAVEIDYSGTSRSQHEIVKIDSGSRQITLGTTTNAAINPADPVTPIIRTLEIDVTIIDTTGATPAETYKSLSWNQTSNADIRRHYAWVINAASSLVWVQPPGVGTPALPANGGASETFDLVSQPMTPDGFPMSPPLADVGTDGFVDLDDTWIGTDNGPGQRSGLQSLIDVSDIAIIAAPGKTSSAIQLALITQCELLRFRFAVLDGERDPKDNSVTAILAHNGLYDTSFAAYYQPWISVTIDGQQQYLPPSGYMAGIYARVDDARGVWKAPANEPVLNVAALKTYFVTGEQDVLNPRGVDLIRKFEIGGIRVWGGRTLSTDTDLKYINVRRTLIFIEHSLDNGTQWVVFEPNTPVTWARVTDSVSAFLLTQWRSGALFGRKPEQAFFVRCDETTMTADDIFNGRLICEIGVAIVRPAEFVIFRIQQITNFGAAQ
jgi:phage tail sheath protein FI